MPIRRLSRSRVHGKVAGVCAGLADYFDVDVVLVRLVWVVLSIVPGAIIGGVVAYIAAWIVMPEGDQVPSPIEGRRLTLSNTDRKVAGVCGGIADYLDVDATVIRVLFVVLSILFGAVIGGIVAYLAAWIIIPRAQDIIGSAEPAAPSAAA